MILACPFCDSLRVEREGEAGQGPVCCLECGATGPTGDDAVELWNEAHQRIRADLAERDAAELSKLVNDLTQELAHLRERQL